MKHSGHGLTSALLPDSSFIIRSSVASVAGSHACTASVLASRHSRHTSVAHIEHDQVASATYPRHSCFGHLATNFGFCTSGGGTTAAAAGSVSSSSFFFSSPVRRALIRSVSSAMASSYGRKMSIHSSGVSTTRASL